MSPLMTTSVGLAAALALIAGSAPAAHTGSDPAAPLPTRSLAEMVAASQDSDWRPVDDENTLYLELPSGRVVIELAAAFAPRHAANVKALVREGFFDGLSVYRAQDNWVVQWGDADETRIPRHAQKTLAPEFTVATVDGLPFTALPDRDGYAPQAGFANGFPAARDPATGRTWLVHCYAAVGVARGIEPDSGSGTDLYAVIGQAPRHLDRNITLLGRVVQGMELLSVLPRGSAPMGFYAEDGERTPIRRVRVAADLPAGERTPLEIMRTDAGPFVELVESRRNRRDAWSVVPAGHVDVCNVPIPVRRRAPAT